MHDRAPLIEQRQRPMTKTIACYSRREVERGIRFRGSYALISIRDPGSPEVRIPKQSELTYVLELQFHDAEPTSNMTLPPDIKVITEEQAEQIAKYVRHTHASVDGYAVHCEQGMSRSPAVGAAIACYLHQESDQFWDNYQPNSYIYKQVFEILNSRRFRIRKDNTRGRE